MKRYRAYKAKKLKLPRRILFFCIVALIITVLAVILGKLVLFCAFQDGTDTGQSYQYRNDNTDDRYYGISRKGEIKIHVLQMEHLTQLV